MNLDPKALVHAPEVDVGVASGQAHDVGAAHLAVALQDALLLHAVVRRHLAGRLSDDGRGSNAQLQADIRPAQTVVWLSAQPHSM